MKKIYLAKMLSVVLSASMMFTSAVPSYAMENVRPDGEGLSEASIEAAEEETSDTLSENTQEASDLDTEKGEEGSLGVLEDDVDLGEKEADETKAEGETEESTEVDIEVEAEGEATETLEDESYELMADDHYTITFVVGEGAAEGAPLPIPTTTQDSKETTGELPAAPLAAPCYNLKVHDGGSWWKDSDGSVAYANNEEVTGDITCYAVYTPFTYTLHKIEKFFNSNGTPINDGVPIIHFGTNDIGVTYSPDWAESLSPVESVDPYIFEGWYSDSDCTVPATTANTMGVTSDGGTINLYARFEATAGVTGQIGIKAGETALPVKPAKEFQYIYGYSDTANSVFTATVDNADYTAVDWFIYSLKDTTKPLSSSSYMENVYRANGRWNDNNLKKLSAGDIALFSQEYGLLFDVENGKLSIKNQGPKKALSATPFVIEAVSKDNTKNIGRREISLKIKDGNLTTSPNYTTDLVVFETKMGYEVVSSDDTSSHTTPVVQSRDITLESTHSKDYELDDLEFVWIGADADAFEPVTGINNTVYLEHPEVITIKPKTGLTNTDDKAGGDGGRDWDGTDAGKETATDYYEAHAADGIYLATLYARSKAFQTAKRICTVKLVIRSDIAITGAIAHGGKEANEKRWIHVQPLPITYSFSDKNVFYTRSENEPYTYTLATGTPNASTDYYVHAVDLGKIRIGETIDDIVITAKGGTDKITFTDEYYPGIGKSFVSDGLRTTESNSAKEATFRITGKALSTGNFGAWDDGTRYFLLRANEGLDKSDYVVYTYQVLPADVSITIDGEPVQYGKDNNTNVYEWHAERGYTAAEHAKTVLITNNSEDPIEITTKSLSGIEGSAVKLSMEPSARNLTIAPGTTQTITIKPTVNGSLSPNPVVETNCVLTIERKSGTYSFANTSIGLKFIENTNDYDITKPSADNTFITDAYVGEPYSYQFGLTKSSTVAGVTWSVASVTDVSDTSETTDPNVIMAKYGLSFDIATGTITGTPKTITQGSRGDYIEIKVKAVASPATATPTAGVERTVKLSIKTSKNAFKQAVNGAEVENGSTVDLGRISLDQLDTLASNITITNNTMLGIDSVVTSIDSVTSTASTPLTDGFELVFDEESETNNAALAAGYSLAAGGSRQIGFRAKDSVTASWLVANAGVYELTVKTLDSASLATKSFVVKFELTAVPKIGYTQQDFKVGVAVALSSSTGKYSIKIQDDGADVASNYRFEWVKGTVPGLTLDPSGIVYGTPTALGSFDVTVKATRKNDSSVTAFFNHSITVGKSSTISLETVDVGVLSNTAIPTAAGRNVLLLQGAVAGDAASSKGTLRIKAADGTAQNITITVEDAEDNRSTSLHADNIQAFPRNPYLGSANYIGVNKTGASSISASSSENFDIVTKGSPAPGVYKVKITITGTNTNTIVFYAMMAVVGKLSITRPADVTTNIGGNFAANVAATGGGYSQTIIWGEDGTLVTSGTTQTTEYYVTPGSGSHKGEQGYVSEKTGLKLTAENKEIGSGGNTAAESGLINDVTGIMKVKGTYIVNINAAISSAEFNSDAQHGGKAVTADPMNSDQLIYLSRGELVNTAMSQVYPRQEGAKSSFKIVSTKSNDVGITGILDSSKGTIEGLKNGDTQVGFDGFVWNGVPTGYDKTTLQLDITVKNTNTLNDMRATAAVSASGGFEIVAPATQTIGKNGGTKVFSVRPKEGLAKRTYTDTLTISGDDFETITFTLKFTVQDKTYLATISTETREKKIIYAVDNVPNGAVFEFDNYVAGQSKSSIWPYVRNTGTERLSNLSVYEVKADGSTVPTADRILNIGGYASSVEVNSYIHFEIEAVKSSAGVYNTYINFHFTEGIGSGAAVHDVKIPVKYMVYDNAIAKSNISILPEDISIQADEGYNPADKSVQVIIKNNATSATSVLTGYTVEMASGSLSDFTITTKAKNRDIAPGESIVYTLTPKKGLMEKRDNSNDIDSYSGIIEISGGNLASEINKTAKFTVHATSSCTVKVTTSEEGYTYILGASTDDATENKRAMATRLYNSLVYGLAARESANNKDPKVSFVKYNESSQKVYVDFDNDSASHDVTFYFWGTYSEDKLTRVSGASVENNSVKVASEIVELTANDIFKATGSSTGENGDRLCYKKINFSFLGKVSFGDTSTEYAETKEALENEYVIVRDTTSDSRAKGVITAYVPYGETLGSVFNGGKLPTAVENTKAMVAWKNGDVIVAANAAITDDIALTPYYHTHTYAESTETNEAYVKWIWKKDAQKNLSAELHLHCTDPDCPDRAASEIVVNDASAIDNDVIQNPGNGKPIKYDTYQRTGADCEHGAGYKYPASAKVLGKIYTGYFVDDETDAPLGHVYNLDIDPVITWNDRNSDGVMTVNEVKVTRTCIRNTAHVKELNIVSVGEVDKKEPTCTEDGSASYTITYTDITENGASAGNVTVRYNNGAKITIKAKGHSDSLIAKVEDFDDNTYKAYVTLTCPDCKEVLFERALVQFVDDGSGSFAYKATLKDGSEYTVTYATHAHIWTGEWSWASDYSKATLTLTCTQGTKPEKRTFTVDSVATRNGIEWTYTVSKTYTWTEKGETKSKEFSDSISVVKSDDGEIIEDVEKLTEGIYIIGLATTHLYTGSAIQPSFNVVDARKSLTYLVKGTDYTVAYKNNKNVSTRDKKGNYEPTAEVIVTGKGNYTGQAVSAKFVIADPAEFVDGDCKDLKGASIRFPKEDIYYNGDYRYPSSIELKVKGGEYVKYELNQGYNRNLPGVITVSNNVNKGTATYCLTGKNGTSVKKTFTIKACDITKAKSVQITVDPKTATWSVKGGTPSVAVVVDGRTLLPGVDFTVKYSGNKKSSAPATVTVTGKGNYTGTLKGLSSEQFSVQKLALTNDMIRAVTAYDQVKAGSVKATVLDSNGDVIKASNYTVSVYAYGNTVPLTKTDKLVGGKTYTVRVTARDTAEITGTAEYSVTVAANLAKAKVTVAKTFAKTYTGEAIYLDPSDFYSSANKTGAITVTFKSGSNTVTLVEGTDFVVSGYTGNIKKGNMTVTLTGVPGGSYSGTKTFKVKIKAKSMK